MDKSFHYMIMVNQSLFQKKVLDALSPYKLTAGQPKVLDYLGKHNGCIQKSIATGCQIEPATLTGILSRMEEKKLIIRQTKDGNKRSLYVYLTDEGKRLQEIVNDTFEKVENEILSGISESEKEQFINTFFKIRRNYSDKQNRINKTIHIFTCWTFRQRTRRKLYHKSRTRYFTDYKYPLHSKSWFYADSRNVYVGF